MLPYIPHPSIQIGAMRLYAFGFCLSTGIILIRFLIDKEVRRRGLNQQIGRELFLIGLLIGLPLSHVFGVLWGEFDAVMRDPIFLIQFNKSIDSFAGFLGFTIGFLVYKLYWRPRVKFLPYLDCAAYGMCGGWIVCRLGCALAHDHPGTVASAYSLLAIDYPYPIFGGVPRHNMGLYEAIGAAVIFIVLHVLSRKKINEGVVFSKLLIFYGSMRFILDFWRATDLHYIDIRYEGLTPAQWGSILIVLLGYRVLFGVRKNNGQYQKNSSGIRQTNI